MSARAPFLALLTLLALAASAIAVPAPAPLEQLVRQADWIVVGELGPLRPADPAWKPEKPGDLPVGMLGDIRIEKVLKGPAGVKTPGHLTLFTLNPVLLKTPFAPVGALFRMPGQRGIWLLEAVGKTGEYNASNPNSFLPLTRLVDVDRLIPLEEGPVPPKRTPPGAATVAVAADGSGDCRTLGEGLARVREGGTLRVRPGVYREGVKVEKAVTIAGDEAGKVIVEASAGDCFYIAAPRVHLQQLVLRCLAKPEQKVYAVDVASGETVLEECELTSTSLACLGVHGRETRVLARGCRIHDGSDAGVFLYEGATGRLEGCHVFACREGNVVVERGSELVLRDCSLYAGQDVGLDVRKGATVTLVGCRIHDNAQGQLIIERRTTVRMAGCRIGMEEPEPGPPPTEENRNDPLWLFARYGGNPTAEGFLQARRAVLAHESFSPARDEKALDEAEQLITAEKLAEAGAKVRGRTHTLILSPRAHLILAFLSRKDGDQKGVEFSIRCYQLCCRGIAFTGEGTAARPYLVLRRADLYDMLTWLKKEHAAVATVRDEGRVLDVVTCTDGSEVVFDVTVPFHGQR